MEKIKENKNAESSIFWQEKKIINKIKQVNKELHKSLKDIKNYSADLFKNEIEDKNEFRKNYTLLMDAYMAVVKKDIQKLEMYKNWEYNDLVRLIETIQNKIDKVTSIIGAQGNSET